MKIEDGDVVLPVKTAPEQAGNRCGAICPCLPIAGVQAHRTHCLVDPASPLLSRVRADPIQAVGTATRGGDRTSYAKHCLACGTSSPDTWAALHSSPGTWADFWPKSGELLMSWT